MYFGFSNISLFIVVIITWISNLCIWCYKLINKCTFGDYRSILYIMHVFVVYVVKEFQVTMSLKRSVTFMVLEYGFKNPKVLNV